MRLISYGICIKDRILAVSYVRLLQQTSIPGGSEKL